jgi:hypothetical protein
VTECDIVTAEKLFSVGYAVNAATAFQIQSIRLLKEGGRFFHPA